MDASFLVTMATVGVAAVSIFATATLRGWQDWLAVRRLEIARRGAGEAPRTSAGRIEVADLKERVRRLEAIAAGVET